MSLRNQFINTSEAVFENVDVNNTLNVDGLIVYQGIQLSPSGGGAGTTVSNSDGSVTVTSASGGYVLSNAGQSQSGDMNLNNHNIDMVGQLGFSSSDANVISVYVNNGVLAYNQVGQNTGNCYDDLYNFPYISTILAKNNNCNNTSLTNVNQLGVNSKLSVGTYGVAPSNGDLVVANGSQTQVQLKQNGDVVLSSSGNVYVTNGSSTGRVYDTVINVPPSVSGSTGALYFNNWTIADVNATVSPDSTVFTLATLNNAVIGSYNVFKLTVLNLSFQAEVNNGGSSSGATFNLYLASENNEILNASYGNGVSITLPNQALSTNNTGYLGTLGLWLSSAQSAIYLVAQVSQPLNVGGTNIDLSSIKLNGFIECTSGGQYA